MLQHVLDDGIRTLAVLHDLVEIAPKRVHQFINFSAGFVVERLCPSRCPAIHRSIRWRRREIVDEIERVLHLVCDASGQLAERRRAFGLDQTILCGSQILQRFAQIVGPLPQFI